MRQKKLFGKTVLDIPSLAHACGFCYGSNNDFYILQENEQSQGTAVFYNPGRIGRGIFFDGSKAREGYYEISYNIPTTKAEITDFTKLAGEMERRLGRVEIIQALDVYYTKPRLLQKNDTKEIGAFYVLAEECESVFPVCAEGFLNLSKLKITDGFVQFVLYSGNRVLEGMFPYGSFIEEMRKHDGVRQFDADHILIPPMTKAELEELAGELH